MNNVGGALNFNATLNLNEWRRNVDQIRRDILGLNQQTQQQTSQMDTAFRNLSIGVASYFSVHVVRDFINELITVRGEFQQMENAIETITGSTSQMNKLMDEWKELTLRSPFRLSEIGQAGKQLLAYGIDVNKVTHDIEMLANVASGVSAPIGDIAYVYGTLKTQGRAYTRDILQFTMRGIPLMDELAKVMNVNVSELKGLIEAGKVGFPEVEKAMNRLTTEGGKFNNLIGKQATTLTGSVNRLKHEFELMLNEIGTNNENILKGGIDAITHLIENYQEVGRVLLTLIEIYGIYRTALLVTTAIQKASIAVEAIKTWISLARSIRTAADAQALFNLTARANPYTLIITVIGALLAITYNYRQELGELTGMIEEQTNSQKAQEEVMSEYHRNFAKGVNETKANISELIGIIKNESSTLEMRKAAYEKLIKIDQTFIGVLDGQYKATNRLGQALEYVTSKIDAFAMAQAKAAASRKILEESFEEQFKRDALKVQADSAQKEADKWKKMDEEARKAGKASLEYMRNAYDAEKRRDKLLEQLEKQRKVANEKTGISNAIIRSNQQEINQKTKVLNQLREEVRLGKLNGEQLELKKKQIEKLDFELNGFKPQIIQSPEENKKSEGWAERIKAQIEELESQAQKAPTQAAYQAIRNRIDKLNELLNPKKNKQENQIAEILPEGSIKELERRAQLLNDAIDTAVNGVVKLRNLDKFGHDKDKKGNPYLTGETVSTEEAYKRLQQIQDEIDSKRYKSNKDRLDETKTQFENYYSIASYYGKEIADKQYAPLISKSKNYLQYVEGEVNSIEKRIESGEKLSKSDQEYLVMLRNEMDSLNGFEAPIEAFKREFENTLKLMTSYIDQIDAIDNAIDKAFQKEGGNSKQFLDQKKYLEELRRNAVQAQKEQYVQFINEHQTFEQRKVEITKKYDDIRLKIQKSNDSDLEKTRLTDEANKAQAKDISSMSVELFQKTDLWVKAFGDLNRVGPKTLRRMRDEFKKFLDSDAAKALKPEDLKTVQDAYDKLDESVKSRNPFAAISISIGKYSEEKKKLADAEKKYGKNSKEYNEQLENTRIALANIFKNGQDAANAVIGFASDLGGALGLLSQESQEALKNAQQLFDGIINAVTGYFSGDYAKMAGGIVQMITSISKAMNGDIDRNKSIQQWGIEIEKLKSLYEQLNKTIEKTAGEAQLKMNQDLIQNLKQQQDILAKMRDTENEKKNSDTDKIASYTQQIEDINNKIAEIADNFKNSITGSDFKDLSQKMAEALTSAFTQGEDAAKSFDKVVDDVMRNAVQNALRIKFLEPAAQKIVDQIYQSMGFGNGDASTLESQIKLAEKEINDVVNKLKNTSVLDGNYLTLYKKREELEKLISSLKEQIATSNTSGGFDGLTQEERDKNKESVQDAMKKYMEGMKQYQDLFGQAAENAQGLKGDIKGITEKTAGALEGQLNAMRIMQAEALKRFKDGLEVMRSQLLVQSQIEMNTRPIKGMYEEIKSMNSKIKNSLAGIP
ncbi:tape measure protein [Chryseobacterium sp. JV274]|uniref:tape measure protein n=1 Tax=Chryseobacterium sp. JV274 TaxID=1932669 RepID=UPI0015C2900E|nr:tape measure protein [Chryseobacterium sp. JV274]CAD0220292.1 Chromosome segregation protein SMC [Chryseobacterium sp. JV274]